MAIESKVVAIAGASSGIGEATAKLLASRGAKVVLGARGEKRLQAVAAQIERSGGEVAFRTADVTSRDDLASLVTMSKERFGKLDVLISNAGMMPIGPLTELAGDDWMQTIDVGLKGVPHGIAAALPLSRMGSIVPDLRAGITSEAIVTSEPPFADLATIRLSLAASARIARRGSQEQ